MLRHFNLLDFIILIIFGVTKLNNKMHICAYKFINTYKQLACTVQHYLEIGNITRQKKRHLKRRK